MREEAGDERLELARCLRAGCRRDVRLRLLADVVAEVVEERLHVGGEPRDAFAQTARHRTFAGAHRGHVAAPPTRQPGMRHCADRTHLTVVPNPTNAGAVGGFGGFVEHDEADDAHAGARARDGGDRDRARGFGRIAVHARGDRGERHRRRAELVGLLERAPIAAREQLGLAVPAAPPHRSDGVDDPRRAEPEAGRRLCVTDRATAQLAARGEQLWTGGAVDRAVDSAAAQQRRVRGVHDRVDRLAGDVASDDLEIHGARMALVSRRRAAGRAGSRTGACTRRGCRAVRGSGTCAAGWTRTRTGSPARSRRCTATTSS